MYQINVCSPISNVGASLSYNLNITRLLMVTVLFLLYLMYLVIMAILTKTVYNLKSEDSGSRLAEKEAFKKQWESQYLYVFGDHSVAIGFVLCFSPYELETALSITYFLLRLFYEIKLQKSNQKVKFIKTILRVINLSLFLCAMIGLSRSQYDQNLSNCRDSSFRF